MVTMPAVPPYSSTTTAKWVRSRCISRSSASTFLDSGTKTGARITSPSIGPRSPGSSASALAIMSLM